ncbi:P-loop containing nucleoside triphosphate hydrolase protein, partial [Truncatella angustata]
RIVIAIAGMPGSGKTHLAKKVTARLNERCSELYPGSGPVAAYCPMDGYHWPRAVLDTFKDPKEAHDRRGAPFTFDEQSFLKLVQSLRVPLDKSKTVPIYAPSFDHAAKDPVDNDIEIQPGHRIVVFEGNYVCLDEGSWRQAADLMDLRWFVQVDENIARKRLADRHVVAKIVTNREDGLKRADGNDIPNGQHLAAHKVPNIDEIVFSLEDEEWAPEKEDEEDRAQP